ncbi:MAG: tRNA 4-thiouridine(8) synthase ThiI, partial [Caldiserica bacterium]|nr:tRNA 4-thiouridine(8) synthase ThiI [Caldisericota bacterium]
TLAAYLVKIQGVEVIGINFRTPFCCCEAAKRGGCAAKEAVEFLKIPLKMLPLGEEMLGIVKNPRFGYGQGLNPCIDCKIMMWEKAKRLMEKEGAKFLVSGEVVGQRPMSQRRRIIELIERESGLEGKIVRPLSAKLLPPSLPEREGWVKREDFLKIEGRSRKVQMALAQEIGLTHYPSPAGGCLLTDPGFARRMKDLIEHKADFSLKDIEILKIGRHFRLDSGIKAIVGRNEEENKKLEFLVQGKECTLQVKGGKGALVVLEGECSEKDIADGASLSAFYSAYREEEKVEVAWKNGEREGLVVVEPGKRGRLL